MADGAILCHAPSLAAEVIDLGSWSCCATPPGAITHPEQLAAVSADWLPAAVPGTVASALAAAGRWNWDQPLDIDAHDWWFRTTFQAPDLPAGHACLISFAGLATLAEVWLNGQQLLVSDNMFRRYEVDVASRLERSGELVIGFRSLAQELARKRPRPRWKTNLVANQQLRWFRTSLLGRIPGWSPVAPAVGPWRGVRLESGAAVVRDLRVSTRLEGSCGLVKVRAQVVGSAEIERAALRVGDCEAEVTIAPGPQSVGLGGEVRWLEGELRIENPPLWWPHTHGEPALLDCQLHLESADAVCQVDCGRVGFRLIEAGDEGNFGISVNGQPVHCRGACWTSGDLLAAAGSEDSLRHDLRLARDAGVNMLRVGGTMVYESDSFFRLCDELGILVWQDFMFANMDYPVEDAAFGQNIAAEASEQLGRLASHPCVAVYCGSSEIEQQAAMLGMPRELWRNDWFGRRLPDLVARHHPGTVYVPSTPTGGVLPFHTRSGLTHFYGIGAYLRSSAELRQADVQFTPECLGFANIPEPATIEQVTGGGHAVCHDPRWKRRVPRDTGAGWDFEDVRDHYLRTCYGVDPVQLRSCDLDRYLQLGRMVSGEMMARAFSEWRSGHSHNRGALVWFYKDLWPGAGWGIVDSTGTPKAAWYHLRRTWQPRQLVITDEGLNGLDLHLVNESAQACGGRLEVVLLREPQMVVGRAEIDVQVAARATNTFSADAILGRFYDVNYAYRFGPPQHDVVIATWLDDQRRVLSEGFYFVRPLNPPRAASAAIDARAEALGDGQFGLSLVCQQFLQGVRVEAKGYLPDDNYFHLPPERTKRVLFRPVAKSAPAFKANVEALNIDAVATIGVS